MRRTLSLENAKHSDGPSLRARIGIGAGEPVLDGDALFGSAVNLAARVCNRAEPSEILVTRVVRDLCMGKAATFISVGQVELKGFEEPHALERVEWNA